MLVKLDHFPGRAKNKTCLKPPPSLGKSGFTTEVKKSSTKSILVPSFPIEGTSLDEGTAPLILDVRAPSLRFAGSVVGIKNNKIIPLNGA